MCLPLAVRPDAGEDWRPEDAQQAVLSVCSGLIMSAIRWSSSFSHFSVKEFLTSSRLVASSLSHPPSFRPCLLFFPGFSRRVSRISWNVSLTQTGPTLRHGSGYTTLESIHGDGASDAARGQAIILRCTVWFPHRHGTPGSGIVIYSDILGTIFSSSFRPNRYAREYSRK